MTKHVANLIILYEGLAAVLVMGLWRPGDQSIDRTAAVTYAYIRNF